MYSNYSARRRSIILLRPEYIAIDAFESGLAFIILAWIQVNFLPSVDGVLAEGMRRLNSEKL